MVCHQNKWTTLQKSEWLHIRRNIFPNSLWSIHVFPISMQWTFVFGVNSTLYQIYTQFIWNLRKKNWIHIRFRKKFFMFCLRRIRLQFRIKIKRWDITRNSMICRDFPSILSGILIFIINCIKISRIYACIKFMTLETCNMPF